MSDCPMADYVVVGGGTAGVVVAARLARRGAVHLLEAGPPDTQERVLDLGRWPELLGSDLDWDYGIEPQPRGNGGIRHSRARVLGGCSSHNSCIAFRTPDDDLRRWEAAGAAGWSPEAVAPAFERVLAQIPLERAGDNPVNLAFVDACVQTGLPRRDFLTAGAGVGAGLFALNRRGRWRQSSSVAYLHSGPPLPGLAVHTGVQARRLVIEHGRAVAVDTDRGRFEAARQIVVACGAFDTPRLLLLSGIGPARELGEHGIAVIADLPGVGANLVDHPEGVLVYRTRSPVPPQTTQFWEAGLFARTDRAVDAGPDLMAHFGLVPFDLHTAPAGYPTAADAVSITPNVALARSRGTVRLRSGDPAAAPRIDFRYFTDPEGYDEALLLQGMRLARSVASQPALAEWIDTELAPGAAVTGDAELSAYGRATANTVYHPAGTCRMGADDDPAAVVDPQLRVRGVDGLRLADASVFPDMIRVNPALTCMMIGERCADFVAADEDG